MGKPPAPSVTLPQLASKTVKLQQPEKTKKLLSFPAGSSSTSTQASSTKPKPIPKDKKEPASKPKSKTKAVKEEKASDTLPPAIIKPVSPPAPTPPKPKTPILGKVQVLYNHYHEFFPIRDGILSGTDIDDKYSFSFVFKGNFQVLLLDAETNEYIPKLDNSRWDFANLTDGKVYRVEIELDPEEQKRMDARPVGSYGYKAAKPVGIKSGNAASDLITQELKGMTQEQLMEKGERYKELIEARELEDALYS
ncbi:hypothetical protein HDU79_007327 [Rhizoclosmatium sp. JEL0117]|nr:hypothetical protein HDU79_007327 [Rhizoclosmatium sp. JEL0117]